MTGGTVGFVGLGIMGGPMAANLVRAGFDVVGFNRSRPKADRLVEAGGRAAASAAEAARDRDVVISMLPDSPDVEDFAWAAVPLPFPASLPSWRKLFPLCAKSGLVTTGTTEMSLAANQGAVEIDSKPPLVITCVEPNATRPSKHPTATRTAPLIFIQSPLFVILA